MARKPYIAGNQQREARQQSYLATPVLGDKFPDIGEVRVEFRFTDPEQKLNPSPQQRVFAPDMHLFFDFQCPLRDCVDGGFNLATAINPSLSNSRAPRSGKHVCQGTRPRTGDKHKRCLLELEYKVATRDKASVAA